MKNETHLFHLIGENRMTNSIISESAIEIGEILNTNYKKK